MNSFLTFIEEATAKRFCKGPNCGVTTAHTVETHPETGATVWKCGNCGHTTPKRTRMTAKKAALDKLFNDLTK